jgi:hypothetical protein
MSIVRRMYALMAARTPVVLPDGRQGIITRVDTAFPANQTTVSVWTSDDPGSVEAKIRAEDVVTKDDDALEPSAHSG